MKEENLKAYAKTIEKLFYQMALESTKHGLTTYAIFFMSMGLIFYNGGPKVFNGIINAVATQMEVQSIMNKEGKEE